MNLTKFSQFDMWLKLSKTDSFPQNVFIISSKMDSNCSLFFSWSSPFTPNDNWLDHVALIKWHLPSSSWPKRSNHSSSQYCYLLEYHCNILWQQTLIKQSHECPGNIAIIAMKWRTNASFVLTHPILSARHLVLLFPSMATIKMYGHSKEFIFCFMKSTCNSHPCTSKSSLITLVCHTIAVATPFSPFPAIWKSNDGSDFHRVLRYCPIFLPSFSNVSLKMCSIQYFCLLNCLAGHWTERSYIHKCSFQVLFVFGTRLSPNVLYSALLAPKRKFLNFWAVRCDWEGLISDSSALRPLLSRNMMPFHYSKQMVNQFIFLV